METAAAAAAEGAFVHHQQQPCSLYCLALANGVSELLDVYRAAVLRVEAHLTHLGDAPPPPLLTLQQFLLEFEVLLPEVAALVAEVEGRGAGGAEVMRLLAARAHSGVPAVQSCAQRLLWHCRQVLFKQLESWLVHGLLLDRGGEFFVQRAGAGAEAQHGTAASPSPLRLGPGGAPDVGPMLDWEPLEWHAGFEVGRGGLLCLVCVCVLFLGMCGVWVHVLAVHLHSWLQSFTTRILQLLKLIAATLHLLRRCRLPTCHPACRCRPPRRCCSSARQYGC